VVGLLGRKHTVWWERAQFSQFLNFTPVAPYILYWHAASGTMQLGKWGEHITAANYQSKMLCFKFGSVVGMDWNGDFTTANIKFNPMTTPSSVTNDWATVPYYSTADWNAGRKDVSASTYHTAANVKAGKGDPCKLVGMTVTDIRNGATDNHAWRLPLRENNQTFVGSSTNQFAGSDYYIWTPNGENATNPGVGILHKGTANDAQLPAAGLRMYGTGEVIESGIAGRYWNSEITLDEAAVLHGYRFAFDSASVQLFGHSHATDMAFAVRCVPQS
jgi:hypothetical protein